MDRLITDTISFLKQEALVQNTVLATPEEYDYFSPKKASTSSKKTTEAIDPDMRELITQVLPHVALTNDIPSDREAKHFAHLWKQEFLQATVLVLCTTPSEIHINLTEAIHQRLAPAKLLTIDPMEKEGKWEIALSSSLLKLVLAPPLVEWKSLSLARFYRENPSSQSTFLNNTPLFLMQPPTFYQKNPDLKKELWKSLSSLLSSSM
jgi:hypothetical protein